MRVTKYFLFFFPVPHSTQHDTAYCFQFTRKLTLPLPRATNTVTYARRYRSLTASSKTESIWGHSLLLFFERLTPSRLCVLKIYRFSSPPLLLVGQQGWEVISHKSTAIVTLLFLYTYNSFACYCFSLSRALLLANYLFYTRDSLCKPIELILEGGRHNVEVVKDFLSVLNK